MKIVDNFIDMAGKYRYRVDISSELAISNKKSSSTVIMLKFNKQPKSDQDVFNSAQAYIDRLLTEEEKKEEKIAELDRQIAEFQDEKTKLEAEDEK